MTSPAAERALDLERDIRISIWNGLSKSGVRQDFAQIYTRAIMEETCMQRALASIRALAGGEG